MRQIMNWNLFIRVLLVGLLGVLLVGCGEPEQEDIKTQLSGRLAKMEGYEAQGTMTIHQPGKPSVYQVKVVYQAPNYYRIELESDNHQMKQTVYRNDQGVFLVTPHVNKTFRFQSEWPGPHGQVYLYQTLLQAIAKDEKGVMQPSEDGKQLLFHVRAVYPHQLLTAQKIWLDAKTLAPQKVEVSDAKSNVRISVVFGSFKDGKPVDPNVFQLPKSMAIEEGAGNNRSTEVTPSPSPARTASLEILEPAYLPAGTEKYDEQSTMLAGRQAVLQRFDGNYAFSLWSVRPSDRSSTVWSSSLVEVAGVFGLMDSPNQLVWWNEGVEYRLHSQSLPVSEMIRVAESVPVLGQKP